MLSPQNPVYLELLQKGNLHQRVVQAYERLAHCDLCAWGCGIDRLAGKKGVCKTLDEARLASYGPHFGDENPLRGWQGSGTIFFARCNLRCQYCQNSDISQADTGVLVDSHELARVMLHLQKAGCHNINLVSPSHVVPQILAAVELAALSGLHLPLVYNTGGYDSLEALQLLDSVVDVYMPDMKYADAFIARLYSKIPHYSTSNQAAVREMHRQVGDLILDDHGLAMHGLLVRHLVLPNNLAGTPEIVRFLAKEISQNTYINLMDQYRPEYQVFTHTGEFPLLNRRITTKEYQEAVKLALAVGLHRLDSH